MSVNMCTIKKAMLFLLFIATPWAVSKAGITPKCSPAEGGEIVCLGGYEYKAIPNDGYTFVRWAMTSPLVDHYSSENPHDFYPFLMVYGGGDFTLTAYFEKTIDPTWQILYTSSDGNVVTDIYTYAFDANIVSNTYQDGQGVITFDGPITSIPFLAFSSCISLTSITIPEGVTSIGTTAFAFCKSLTSITLPESLSSIRNGAFENCTSLTSITIPNSVTSIGERAFNGCTSLTSITCEATRPPTLGSTVFPSNLTTAYIPCGTEEAYEASDWASYSITTFIEEGCIDPTWQILYTSTDGNIVEPNDSLVFGANIVSNEYKDGQGIITFDGPVTQVGARAFKNCSSLKSITIPNSVTKIENNAFMYCSSLTSVTIPNSVTSIGTSAFVYCSSLTSVILTALSEEEFCKGQGNSLLYSKGVNYQREIQINGTKVTKFTIPNSVTSIGDEAFRGCSSLTSVTIPNSVTSIGWSAFYGCSSLTSVTIPNSVTSIGGFAFNGCSSLTSITIPNSVTSIGIGTFQSCTGLTSVTIGNSVTSIGSSAFSGCSSLSSVTIHNSVTSIGGSAFEGCSKLTSMTIPNSVTSIGIGAFEGCTGFTSVTIPNSVTNIGNNAFYGCTGLTSVTIEADTPPTIGIYCFYYYEDGKDFPLNISIYVPCGSLDTYKTAEGWSDYASLIRYAPYSSYNINKKAENGHITTSSTNIFTMCDTEHPVICTANPNRGCYFVRWADGNTENPRTIELTQDTTMEAIFDYLLTGKCGKDSALTWTFEPASMALNITGKGALSENYTYGTFIESLTIGNEVTTIGEDAFYKCTNLKNVIIGSAVKVLEKRAFYNCSSIETITCYSMRPPTVNQDALYGLDYSTIVYVPADYLNTYKMHDAWGLYDVRPLGATSAETEDVKITPSENEANVTWPSVNGSATYELVIKDKDGNIVCTFIFNANGQLTSIAFNAPSRNGVPAQTQIAGFSFTITGLDSGTGYDLTLTAKDNSGNAIQTETISFVTTGGNVSTDMDQVQSNEIHSTKVIKDGQVLILRNGKTYTMQGQEVK